MIVAWTGHRPDVFLDPSAARAAVESAARDVVDQAADRFLVGGQRGVDTWAALAAIDLTIPFVVILPFTLDEFTRDWVPADRALLERTMSDALEVRIAGGYTRRNEALATGADLLVAVWTRILGGGTAETLELARRAGTPVREIVLEPSPAVAGHGAHGRGI
jgi:hypothetical protein